LKEQPLKEVTLYGDGSSLGNPGPGGYGGILEYNGIIKKFSGANEKTTNNRMELLAVIEGLKLLKEPCRVHVISDSKYVVDAINSWLANWIKKEFKNVKNVDLWKEYVKLSTIHRIRATWVRGHNGHPQNEECDRMAFQEAQDIKAIIEARTK